MLLTYHGPHDAVELDLPNGGVATVPHGGSYDFPAELAEALLEQPSNWKSSEAEQPLADRVASARTHAQADALAAELGVDVTNLSTVSDKLGALRAALASGDSAGNAGDDNEE